MQVSLRSSHDRSHVQFMGVGVSRELFFYAFLLVGLVFFLASPLAGTVTDQSLGIIEEIVASETTKGDPSSVPCPCELQVSCGPSASSLFTSAGEAVLYDTPTFRHSIDREGLGHGHFAVDGRMFGKETTPQTAGWDSLGLLLRLSVGIPLVVGGAFHMMPNIQSFATAPWILIPAGALLVLGVGVRTAELVAAAVMVWYIASKISLDKSLIANLNSFKREFAFLAADAVLAYVGGGTRLTLRHMTNWRYIVAAPGRPSLADPN